MSSHLTWGRTQPAARISHWVASELYQRGPSYAIYFRSLDRKAAPVAPHPPPLPPPSAPYSHPSAHALLARGSSGDGSGTRGARGKRGGQGRWRARHFCLRPVHHLFRGRVTGGVAPLSARYFHWAAPLAALSLSLSHAPRPVLSLEPCRHVV